MCRKWMIVHSHLPNGVNITRDVFIPIFNYRWTISPKFGEKKNSIHFWSQNYTFCSAFFFKRKAILKKGEHKKSLQIKSKLLKRIHFVLFLFVFFSFWINSLFWNNIRESMRISFNEIFGISVKMRFFAKCHKTLT